MFACRSFEFARILLYGVLCTYADKTSPGRLIPNAVTVEPTKRRTRKKASTVQIGVILWARRERRASQFEPLWILDLKLGLFPDAFDLHEDLKKKIKNKTKNMCL